MHYAKQKMRISHFNKTNLTQPCQNATPTFFFFFRIKVARSKSSILTKRHVQDLCVSTIPDSPKQKMYKQPSAVK